MIPNMIPFAMDDVNGIMMIARNAEMTSDIGTPSNCTFLICVIIRYPTYTRAGVVAKPGTERKSGDRIRETRKRIPVVTEVSPVLPPAAAPAEDSTKDVTVDVPQIAPTHVPIASERRACLALGRLPSSSRRSALAATPMSVPTVSKMSTYRNENTITTKSRR